MFPIADVVTFGVATSLVGSKLLMIRQYNILSHYQWATCFPSTIDRRFTRFVLFLFSYDRELYKLINNIVESVVISLKIFMNGEIQHKSPFAFAQNHFF